MTCHPHRAENPVSRTEILDHVAGAFVQGPVTRADLLGVAARAGARDELLVVLQALPEGRYHRPQDLWSEFPDLPVEV